MCLTGFMIWILPYYYNLDFVKRAQVKCVEYQLSGRIDCGMTVLLTDKVCQSLEIRLVKLRLQMLLPALVYPNVHILNQLYSCLYALGTHIIGPDAGLNLTDVCLLEEQHAKTRLTYTAAY